MDYPILKLPPNLKTVAKEGLVVPRPSKPKEPDKDDPTGNLTHGCLSIVFFGASLMLVMGAIPSMVTAEGDMGALTLPLLLVSIVTGFFFLANISRSKDLKEKQENYQDNLKEYEKQMKIYERQQACIVEMTDSKRLTLGLLDFYESILPPVKHDNDYKTGQSEPILYNTLKRYFGKKILQDHTIETFGEIERPYMPDMVYYNKKSGICIDIEIDEKYEREYNVPIHYKDCDRDQERDDFFVMSKWIVLRFAERQVLGDAEGCAKMLLEIVLKYDPEFHFSYRHEQLSKNHARVSKLDQWTYEEVWKELNKRRQ